MTGAHDYLSTACHHHLHAHCRLSCKFCPARCRCACHETRTHPTGATVEQQPHNVYSVP